MRARAALALAAATVRARLAWRGDVGAAVAADAVSAAVGLAMVGAVVRGGGAELAPGMGAQLVAAWGFAEIGRAAFAMWLGGTAALGPHYVLGGGLDRVLLRPGPPLLHLVLDHVRPGAWPGVLWGSLALGAVAGEVGAGRAMLAAVVAVAAAVVLGGSLLALASLAFWLPHRGRFVGLGLQLAHHGAWPASWVPAPVALALRTVFPVAFAAIVPGAWWVGAAPSGAAATVAVAALAGWVGVRAFQAGVRRYASVGN